MSSASWIAIRGIAKDEALSRMALRDTGEIAEISERADHEKPFGTDLPGGWFLAFCDEELFPMEYNFSEISTGCRIVSFWLSNTVNTIEAECFEDGEQVWNLSYDGMSGPSDIHVCGTPPDGYQEIHDRHVREQQAQGQSVDCMVAIPVEAAALEVAGFRYDEFEYDWGKIAFTRLETADAA